MSSERFWLISLPVVLALAACSDSPRPYGARTTVPAEDKGAEPFSPAAKGEGPAMAPPANTAATAPGLSAPSAPAHTSNAPTVRPDPVEDVEAKKGSETGMVGGASGTAASGGKPGANMPGAGEAAQTTGEPTTSSK